MSSILAVTVQPATRVQGRVRPPGDKSISHRYAMLSALADGMTTIHGYSTGADCASTLSCLRALGVEIEELARDPTTGLQIRVHGCGLGGLHPSSRMLDAGNSGSTMRMLAGILAAHPFDTGMTGDASLRGRPMRRIIVPLEQMGARVGSADGRPPLTIQGTRRLNAIDFAPDVPSAQVKSAVLLAGLHAEGLTRVTEPLSTRDHTERALEAFGAQVGRAGRSVAIRGGQRLIGGVRHVPGDISSAAFWMAAAAALPGSRVTVDHVGVNPTRAGIIDILRRMGAEITVTTPPGQPVGEPYGVITVCHAEMVPTEILPEEVPGVIDELPVLAALATHGGDLRVTGAQELRVKESDRIAALAEGLRRMGGEIDEQPDGFHVNGRRRLRGGEVDAKNDHRLAMAFAIAALGATGATVIHDAGAAAVSYPDFFPVLESLRVKADKLYLVGFMGAGKSTVARALSRRLGWRVEDIDERIERREGRRVSGIFAQQGEAYFRQLERAVLYDLLPERNLIIATGGGTFAEADNRAAMLADGAVVWLDVPLARVIERVPPDGRRPLAADRTQMEQLYERRQPAYTQAHVRIDASRPVAEVVERLLEWIGY